MNYRSLNLDGMFQPTAFPEIEFKMLKFSGGESHIKLNNNIEYSAIEKVVITTRISNGDQVMQLLIAVDALKRKGIKRFDLVMPYIPYARQDRQCDEGESFTLKVFTGIINSIGFEKVYVFDAHSDVSAGLIDNCVNIDNSQYVSDISKIIDGKNTYLVSPDSGANKKINKLYEKINSSYLGVIKCDKVRNVSTGELSGFEVFADDICGFDCLIVDDICDGGRTFTGIAKELKRKNAGNVYLFVSHGIFSYGFSELSDHFDRIFTTNSFNDITDEAALKTAWVTQFKFEV